MPHVCSSVLALAPDESPHSNAFSTHHPNQRTSQDLRKPLGPLHRRASNATLGLYMRSQKYCSQVVPEEFPHVVDCPFSCSFSLYSQGNGAGWRVNGLRKLGRATLSRANVTSSSPHFCFAVTIPLSYLHLAARPPAFCEGPTVRGW